MTASAAEEHKFPPHLGARDPVTGLLNRSQFVSRMEHLLSLDTVGCHDALLLVDLDRFSLINNSLGHDAGDDVLRHAATQIVAATRSEDTTARLGGDEFFILCRGAGPHDAAAIANRIIQAFDEPARIDGKDLQLTVSIGITSANRHKSSIATMREAYSATQHAKGQGGNTTAVFEKGHSTRASHFLELDQALRKALDREEFILHYQPIHDLADGSVCGVEALVRWYRPGLGMVPPDDFIPAAESSGLIFQIGDWVLNEALQQLSAWKRDRRVPEGMTVSVNLSPLQLTDRTLVSTVQQLLKKHHLIPSDLTLEMTETALVADQSCMQATVTGLASAGVSLSIDDFGTGYSSLAYLRYLPAKELKVDRSFVAGLTTTPKDATLVAAVIGLAHEFGMTCVAEGVETPEQLEQLQRMGCDLAQGFFLGRPMPAVEFIQAMERPLA